MKVKKLLTDAIEEAADTQSRVGLSQEYINELVEAIAAGAELPPIDVFFDGSSYFIGDGWHRFHAWIAADIANIPCYIHDGGERDALLFAAAANKSHGLKRSNRDKRRAVEIIFVDDEWSQWSDNKIAEHCGVTQQFVSRLRSEVTTVVTPAGGSDEEKPMRVGRDGKKYPAPKPKLAATPEPEEAEEEDAGPDINALAAPYKRAANDLTRIKSDLKAIAKDEKVGAHLASKIVRIERDLDGVRGAITQSEPLQRCGKCEGEGCQHCSRTGFWTRMTVESLKK